MSDPKERFTVCEERASTAEVFSKANNNTVLKNERKLKNLEIAVGTMQIFSVICFARHFYWSRYLCVQVFLPPRTLSKKIVDGFLIVAASVRVATGTVHCLYNTLLLLGPWAESHVEVFQMMDLFDKISGKKVASSNFL